MGHRANRYEPVGHRAKSHRPRNGGDEIVEAGGTRLGLLLAGEAAEDLAGAAFGGLGAPGADPRGGQVFPRLGEPPFQVADRRLQLVFRRAGLGGGGVPGGDSPHDASPKPDHWAARVSVPAANPLQEPLVRKCSPMGVPANLSPISRDNSSSVLRGR